MPAEQQPGSFLLCTRDEEFRHAFTQTFQLWMETVCMEAEMVPISGWAGDPAPGPQDVLFLDIDGLDGPLDALTLPCVGALILCSQDPARSIACYALHPVDFLPKPVGLAALERALQRCIPLWQDRLQWLELSAGRVQIPLCELMWAEASGHSLVLHCAHGVIRASESLSKLEAKLPPRLFLRCQRSFLVNLHHIQALEDGCFRMSGGDQVPIGRGGRGLAAQAYAAYRRLFQ